MIRWKATLFLCLLTVGVGAYISLYELRQPTPEEQAQRSKEILNIPTDSVTQLALDLPKVKVTLTRDGSAWRIAPSNWRADESLINRILGHANPLIAERALASGDGSPLDPKGYGLDPAAGWLSLVLDGRATTLLFGADTPVQKHRYMKVADRPTIYVVPAQLFNDANQPPESFRDPLLVRLEPWSADGLTIAGPSSTLSLTRGEDGWALTQPLRDRADSAEVNALLHRLASIRIARFLDDAPQVEQLATWGFDHAALEISLHPQDAGASPTIFFGNPLADDTTLVYAKRSDEPSLYAVAAADLDPLKRDANGLRAKACFVFFTSQVSKVEVRRGGAGWAIERVKDRWQVEGSAQALDAQRVEELLNTLSDLRLSGFVGEAPSSDTLARDGLASPEGTIAVWTTDREAPQRLAVGAVIEGSADRYGRIEGRDAIIRLPPLAADLLSNTPEQLRPSAPASAEHPSQASPRPSPK